LYYRDLIFDVNGDSIWSRRVTKSGTPSLVSILHSSNSSVSKSGQTLTVKINGVEQSLTNTTYSSLKNPNAIKFKKTDGTTVTYDGSSAADLTDGVNYATNAGSANKLTNARTIAISEGAIGTATSFNGTANISIPITSVKEAYLTWGGKNISGSLSPVDAAMDGQWSANRLSFMPASNIQVEYSTNGGSTWTDYGLTNT
jgi:hypothetical protein